MGENNIREVGSHINILTTGLILQDLLANQARGLFSLHKYPCVCKRPAEEEKNGLRWNDENGQNRKSWHVINGDVHVIINAEPLELNMAVWFQFCDWMCYVPRDVNAIEIPDSVRNSCKTHLKMISVTSSLIVVTNCRIAVTFNPDMNFNDYTWFSCKRITAKLILHQVTLHRVAEIVGKDIWHVLNTVIKVCFTFFNSIW